LGDQCAVIPWDGLAGTSGLKADRAYIVKDGEVTWQPAIDVMRIVLGGQLPCLAAIFALRGRRKRR
jgi:hypothetical protein